MGNSSVVDGRAPIHMFASAKAWIEGDAVRQLEHVASLSGVEAVAAMPDLHPGKFGPVGAAILADRVFPALVGSDIGCGMGLYRLDVATRKLRLDRLAERLGALDAPLGDAASEAIDQAGLAPTAWDASLGSIGGGNHFCEVQAIDEIVDADIAACHGLDRTQAYVLVHSGSRGLGHSILEDVQGAGLATLAPGDEAGARHLAAHDHAVTWARLNRRMIAQRAAQAAGADAVLVNDLPHNLVEIIQGGDGSAKALHRKGAAASDRGLVPVPGSRGTLSYLVAPAEGAPAEALASIAHGAGRKYDRASMHGRVRTKKSDVAELKRNPFGGIVVCEDRGLLVEEAPTAYKTIGRVIDDLVAFGLVRIVATFRPLVTFKKGATHHAAARRGGESSRRRGRGARRWQEVRS
ncbi:MAG: RNA ligase RtcB family protein [Hyphomicrobiaceae bacterium]